MKIQVGEEFRGGDALDKETLNMTNRNYFTLSTAKSQIVGVYKSSDAQCICHERDIQCCGSACENSFVFLQMSAGSSQDGLKIRLNYINELTKLTLVLKLPCSEIHPTYDMFIDYLCI